MITLGKAAPKLDLESSDGGSFALSEQKGNYVVVYFYPRDSTPGCTTEALAFRDAKKKLDALGTTVVGVSKDSVKSHCNFRDKQGLNFPLLSDFWPHGEVSRAYDVFDEERGCPRRSSYVVDKDGMVRWSVHNAMPEGRDLDEHLRQLGQLV